MFFHSLESRWPIALTASAVAFSLWGLPAAAPASAVQVRPIKIEVLDVAKTASVTLTNEDTEVVSFRVYGQSWSQVNGKDVQGEARALIISPPLITIEPGKSQLIRVGARKGASPGFYRLILEEIPELNVGPGLKVAVRFDLPFYFAQQRAVDLNAVRWFVQRSPDGNTTLEVRNEGAQYVVIDPAAVIEHTGLAIDPARSSFGAVLPGSTMGWALGKIGSAPPAPTGEGKSVDGREPRPPGR